jgi:hypothetical protein
LTFLFGVGLSLCANIASAPHLSGFAVADGGLPTVGAAARG